MSTPSLIDDNNPVWLPAFKLFLSKVKIASKEFREPGPITLYRAQNMFLDELADGIREGTRHFVVLKARQLGLSTVMLVLDIFWLYMNPGLQGALIADNAINRDDFRKQVAQIMDSLPKGWRVAVAANNRDELRLANGSVLRYLSAGKGKNSGLGRSKGLAYVHATEISSWGDQKGIDSLMDALAIENPNRLFVFESTALGFNVFHDMWEKAKSNAPAERAIFIGWWAKDIYRHAEGSAMFERWWGANPEMDEYEQVVFNIVQEAYGWEITPEQWSWYRERASMRSTDSMQEEMPSTENEAFTSTGHSFFNLKRVDDDVKFITQARPAFNGYNYELHDNFLKMKLHPAVSVDGLELRVWEPPKKRGKYVIGVDPAYGRNEEADRSVVSVWRCFSDKVVQVAEYATPMPETQQVAWVMCHLASEYRDCIINLEISGPGGQIMQEMNSLRQHLQWGHLSDTARQMQVEDCLNGARWFLYHRPDSMGAGYCYNWKCLALDTPLPTPTGWVRMQDVSEGDYLLSEHGSPVRVLGVSPTRINHDCYRVTFDDGTSIVADADHKWKVTRNHWRGKEEIRTTRELLKHNYKIKKQQPLDLSDADLPLDPYVLGAWLGDGTSVAAALTCSEEDAPDMVACLRSRGVPAKVRLNTGRSPTIALTTGYGTGAGFVHKKLNALGLLGNKHIPPQYLRASKEQRLQLLRGLMDTDGGLSGNGGQQCGFTTTSRAIADGMAELLRTFGIKAKFVARNRTLQYAGGQAACAEAYQFYFTPPNDMQVFSLPRKADRLAASRANDGRASYHRIVSVEPVPSVPVKCVMVDNPTSLFLAGEGMIPTHNTSFENKLLIFNKFRDCYSMEQAIVRSRFLLDEMSTLKQDGDRIAASGSHKDDRIFAACLAVYAWDQWRRVPMMAEGQTYASEMAQQKAGEDTHGDKVLAGIIPQFFQDRQRDRVEAYYRSLET